MAVSLTFKPFRLEALLSTVQSPLTPLPSPWYPVNGQNLVMHRRLVHGSQGRELSNSTECRLNQGPVHEQPVQVGAIKRQIKDIWQDDYQKLWVRVSVKLDKKFARNDGTYRCPLVAKFRAQNFRLYMTESCSLTPKQFSLQLRNCFDPITTVIVCPRCQWWNWDLNPMQIPCILQGCNPSTVKIILPRLLTRWDVWVSTPAMLAC